MKINRDMSLKVTCELCGKVFQPITPNHRFCGSKLVKGTCSWENNKGHKYGWIARNRPPQPVVEGKCGLGRRFELKALQTLPGATDCNERNFKGPWDIIWENLKIDVKVRNIYKGKFVFTKRGDIADYYLCYCINGEENILATYLVAKKVFSKNNWVVKADQIKLGEFRIIA